MFGDLDWPLNASHGLSATAEFLVILCVCVCVCVRAVGSRRMRKAGRLRSAVPMNMSQQMGPLSVGTSVSETPHLSFGVTVRFATWRGYRNVLRVCDHA